MRFPIRSGAIDLSWNIEYSDDLQDWTSLSVEGSDVFVNGRERIVLLDAGGVLSRFRRVSMELGDQ